MVYNGVLPEREDPAYEIGNPLPASVRRCGVVFPRSESEKRSRPRDGSNCNGQLTLKLVGENTLSGSRRGLYASTGGSLRITGTGSLSINTKGEAVQVDNTDLVCDECSLNLSSDGWCMSVWGGTVTIQNGANETATTEGDGSVAVTGERASPSTRPHSLQKQLQTTPVRLFMQGPRLTSRIRPLSLRVRACTVFSLVDPSPFPTAQFRQPL